MIDVPIVLEELRAEHLNAANALSEEQSWPHRREDWQHYCNLGEGLVALKDGRVVGTVLAFRFDKRHASIGMLLDAADMQGAGIARTLLLAMLDRLGDNVNVTLSATQERLSLYPELGFVPYAIVNQHQGLAPSMPLVDLRQGERVRPLGNAEPDLAALYSGAMGQDLTSLFAAMAQDSSGLALLQDDEPVGFAFLRRFGRGRVIAPVIARDLDGAKLLASQLLGTQAGRFCRIDAVEGLGMSRWLEALGFPKVNTVTRMVRGKLPAITCESKVFGIAAQAYG